jgi:multidrug resistance efflux pump
MKAVVTARKVQEGEGCEVHQPLLVLVDASQCYFVANVEAPVLASFKVGQEIALRVDAAPDPVTVRGRISYLAPVVDAASGLGELKAVFPNADGAVRPGVAASVDRPEPGRERGPR